MLRVCDRPEAPWRDEIDITQGDDVIAHQVERILVAAQNRPSDGRIVEFGDNGVTDVALAVLGARLRQPQQPALCGPAQRVAQSHVSGISAAAAVAGPDAAE